MTPEEIQKAKYRHRFFEKIHFEENVFLMFALKLLYHRRQTPLPVQQRIQDLQKEINRACKGRRKRIRGKSIRYGKKLIAAAILKRPHDKYQAEKEHIFPLSKLINQHVRGHAETNYEYTAKRSEKAVKEALFIQQQYPAIPLPSRDSVKPTEIVQKKTVPAPIDEDDDLFFNEETLSEIDAIDDYEEETEEQKGWQRPSEEELVLLLNNKCDDNCASDEDEIPSKAQDALEMTARSGKIVQPDLFDPNMIHPIEIQKKTTPEKPKKICSAGQDYPTLFDLQNTRA